MLASVKKSMLKGADYSERMAKSAHLKSQARLPRSPASPSAMLPKFTVLCAGGDTRAEDRQNKAKVR